jgi:type I restriction enzyme M protein
VERRRRTPRQLQAQVLRIFRSRARPDLSALRRFQIAQAKAKLTSQSTGRRTIGKADYHARGVLYLSESARFANLLQLPERADIGRAINDAMKAIEADSEDLKGVLPRTHGRLDKELLVSRLKNFAAIPMDIEGDAFGRIYEYFLGRFAMSEGQKGGEFSRPPASSN